MVEHLKFFFLIVLAFLILAPILGNYLAKIFTGNLRFITAFEKRFFQTLNINTDETDFKTYLRDLIWFNLCGFIFLWILLMIQGFLPLNPQHFDNVPFSLAFNIAASFTTNTNWQSYAGETTLSYLSQMLGLTSHNFLSAATGMACLLALIRGIYREAGTTIGNFYVDVSQMILYILLPLSIILSIVFMYEGIIQSLSPYVQVTTLEGGKETIPFGPVASQIAIKQLGTNGGGFFNANSAFPFENPTFLTNFLETLSLILIPGASVFMYGKMINRRKEAFILFFVMLFLWVAGMGIADYFESRPSGELLKPILEGKEVRFAGFQTLFWSASTTATANGSTNGMIESLSPIAGGICILNMMLGELIFGGIGVGLCSMLMYVLVTVFIAGLMVGRTPEYLGKKIEKNEMQWVMLAVIGPSAIILMGAGIFITVPKALSSISTIGPHGLTEMLYAFTSTTANNGSAFAGIDANNPLYNITLGIVMILGRLVIIIPSIYIAGLLVQKKKVPISSGTFQTNTRLFGVLLTSIILILSGLTFFPALTLGPILEQIAHYKQISF